MRNTGMISVRSSNIGCMKDEKFCDKMKDYICSRILIKYLTLKDCIEEIEEPEEAECQDRGQQSRRSENREERRREDESSTM